MHKKIAHVSAGLLIGILILILLGSSGTGESPVSFDAKAKEIKEAKRFVPGLPENVDSQIEPECNLELLHVFYGADKKIVGRLAGYSLAFISCNEFNVNLQYEEKKGVGFQVDLTDVRSLEKYLHKESPGGEKHAKFSAGLAQEYCVIAEADISARAELRKSGLKDMDAEEKKNPSPGIYDVAGSKICHSAGVCNEDGSCYGIMALTTFGGGRYSLEISTRDNPAASGTTQNAEAFFKQVTGAFSFEKLQSTQ